MVEHVVEQGAIPWCLGRASCGAMTFTGVMGKPQDCRGRVTHAGLVLVRDGGPPQWRCWLSFSCGAHVGNLTAPRPLLPRDAVVRQRWAEEDARAMAGKRRRPPEPLAVGAEAKELHERAMRWAAAQQGDEPPADGQRHP